MRLMKTSEDVIIDSNKPIILIASTFSCIGYHGDMNEWEKILILLKRIDGVIHLNPSKYPSYVKDAEILNLNLFCSFNDVIHHFGNIDFTFVTMDIDALMYTFDLNDNRFNNSELHFLPLTLQIPLPYTLPSIEGKEQLIPKKIHYGWFGGDKKPPLVEYCIQSWYKHHPGWEIIEWNEHNIDMNNYNFIRLTDGMIHKYDPDRKSRKEFFPMYDYDIRLDIIRRCGGIYMDTDMEVIKPLDRFLYTPSFWAIRTRWHLDHNIFGAMKGYDMYPDKTCCNIQNYVSDGMNTLKILDDGSVIYPTDVFTVRDQQYSTFEYFTENTHAIHHNTAGWRDQKWRINTLRNIIRQRKILKNIFGDNSIVLFPDHLLGITRWEPEIMKQFQDT